MKICPVGAELFNPDRRTDRRTDMTELIVAFHIFADAPKNVRVHMRYKEYIIIRLYFPPKEGMLWIFFARKIRSNPRSWVPEASMLTTRPPKPLNNIYIYIYIYREKRNLKIKNTCINGKNFSSEDQNSST